MTGAVLHTGMGSFDPVRVPSPTFAPDRHCAAGDDCVAAIVSGLACSTVLSIYNPGPYCHCCTARRNFRERVRSARAAGMSSKELVELMRNARPVIL